MLLSEESLVEATDPKWKKLRQLANDFLLVVEGSTQQCYERCKDKFPGICYLICGYPPCGQMKIYTVKGITVDRCYGNFTWSSSPISYNTESGKCVPTDRKSLAAAIASKLYFGNFLTRYPKPTTRDIRSIFHNINIYLAACIGYDGKDWYYSSNFAADANKTPSKANMKLRRATQQEIDDPAIAWSQVGSDKYDRKMVNYKLGIWRPLTHSEFYGSGIVD